jgi:hypothetical protein
MPQTPASVRGSDRLDALRRDDRGSSAAIACQEPLGTPASVVTAGARRGERASRRASPRAGDPTALCFVVASPTRGHSRSGTHRLGMDPHDLKGLSERAGRQPPARGRGHDRAVVGDDLGLEQDLACRVVRPRLDMTSRGPEVSMSGASNPGERRSIDGMAASISGACTRLGFGLVRCPCDAGEIVHGCSSGSAMSRVS